MLRPQVIDPFPEDIDRDGFGHWLAGFTDGEGCFCLPYTRNRKRTDAYTPSARFTINLRADDAVILYTIQSYWRKGRVSVNPLIDKRNPNPHIVFHVHGMRDLLNTVVPHFERFPLRAKKARDFAIWKQAVALLVEVSGKPPHRTGPLGRWTQEDLQKFLSLRAALENIRTYRPSPTDPPTGRFSQ
jgi:hypothetical protein